MNNTQLSTNISHYYGNIVRAIFIIIAIILLIGLPQVTHLLQIPGFFALCMIITLGIAAGITNPVQPESMIFNMYVSGFGLMLFAYMNWIFYFSNSLGFVFSVNQLIAVLFFIALYFCIKTFRGYKLSNRVTIDLTDEV